MDEQASPFDSRNVIWDTMGVCVPRQERDHRSIAQDRLFLLLWGRPVNKVNPMKPKSEGVPHWAEDDPKSEGSPSKQRKSSALALVVLKLKEDWEACRSVGIRKILIKNGKR